MVDIVNWTLKNIWTITIVGGIISSVVALLITDTIERRRMCDEGYENPGLSDLVNYFGLLRIIVNLSILIVFEFLWAYTVSTLIFFFYSWFGEFGGYFSFFLWYLGAAMVPVRLPDWLSRMSK